MVDPDLPRDVREALLSRPGSLTSAYGEPPPAPPAGGLTGENAIKSLQAATVCGFLPVIAAPALLGRAAGLAVGAAAQAGLAAVWWSSGFWMFVLAGTALQLLSFAVLLFFSRTKDERAELAHVHHGRYYVEDDFATGRMRDWFGNASPSRLMRRTRKAVSAVLGSDVQRAGLLADGADEDGLRRQEWEIAESLAALSRIGRQLQATVPAGRSGGALHDAVKPQRKALRESMAALRQRVEDLERYADRVRGADAAYRAWQAQQDVPGIDAGTRALLARLVENEPPVDGIDDRPNRAADRADDLPDQADDLPDRAVNRPDDLADRPGLGALRDALREAYEAGPPLTGDQSRLRSTS
ncbi:hypothetical protein [Actinomadura rupiterrae]|uniref:hypothetical protein n=1 Tax=Actinomadura rupiterrae TaxID=559627 RepID=UPI0020A59C8D|nr:hypothetical protein [Actinomadura rupiterrae]MCP2339865.1 hypothetical protein [Actinomadura rupiterrae]